MLGNGSCPGQLGDRTLPARVVPALRLQSRPGHRGLAPRRAPRCSLRPRSRRGPGPRGPGRDGSRRPLSGSRVSLPATPPRLPPPRPPIADPQPGPGCSASPRRAPTRRSASRSGWGRRGAARGRAGGGAGRAERPAVGVPLRRAPPSHVRSAPPLGAGSWRGWGSGGGGAGSVITSDRGLTPTPDRGGARA